MEGKSPDLDFSDVLDRELVDVLMHRFFAQAKF